MSRHHPPVLSLAVLFALSTLLFAAAGCGGDSQEQELKEATAAVVAKREAVQEAREEVEARQQVVDEARKELEAAESELQDPGAGAPRGGVARRPQGDRRHAVPERPTAPPRRRRSSTTWPSRCR